MRQLTGLDAQFLALETPRQTGHVGALAVLDPSTRPNGRLELADMQRLMSDRVCETVTRKLRAAPDKCRTERKTALTPKLSSKR